LKSLLTRLLFLLSCLASIHSDAQATNLLIEDFENPDFSSGTVDPAFPGWTFINTIRSHKGGSIYPSSANQVIDYEYTNEQAYYDLNHVWGASNVYILQMNATPKSWSGSSIRYINPSIRDEDNDVLWSTTTLLPTYNDFNFGTSNWSSIQTFSYVVPATLFSGNAAANLRINLMSSGGRGIYMDNIIFYEQDVTADATPPTPDPPTWSVIPTEEDFVNTTMTADFAYDNPYGVEYFFENVTAGTNSGWHGNVYAHIWGETNLTPSTNYTYRFKVRDKSPNQNETGWSATTNLVMSPSDTTPPTPDPMTWSIEPMVVDDINIYMVASTATDPYLGVEYFFENTTAGSNSGWQSDTTWTELYLDVETENSYRVKARDLSPNANETAWSAIGNITIPSPNVSGELLISGNFQTPILSHGTDASTYFAGWTLSSGAKTRNANNNSDVPGDQAIPNQVIQLELDSTIITYDSNHQWAADDEYLLTLNASPMSWSGASTRYLAPSLLQQDNTILWSSSDLMPTYNNFGRNPWSDNVNLTYTYTIEASSFATGTPGQPLRLKIDSTSQRGVYIDNIVFKKIIPVIPGTIFRVK